MQGWKKTPQQSPKLCCIPAAMQSPYVVYYDGKSLFWVHTHNVNTRFSAQKELTVCFCATCRTRVRKSPVTWCSSNLPTSTWPPACPPLLSPFSSSVASSCSCTGGCSFSSSSTFSQLALAREPRLLLKWCFTFWMMLSETTGKPAQITSEQLFH